MAANPYETNYSLCVLPSDPKTIESQYEAFQSIFAKIMGGREQNDTGPKRPYEVLCDIAHIRLGMSDSKPQGLAVNSRTIFFKKPFRGSTHYRAVTVNGEVKDPYTLYQAKDTQGFCQMFAFFLAIGDEAGFQIVDQTKKIDNPNFDKLWQNTNLCFTKCVPIIARPDIYPLFEQEFNTIMTSIDPNENAAYYGIKPGTTVDKYLNDFITINGNAKAVKFYIYDLPLVGYKVGAPKQNIWDYIQSSDNTEDMNDGGRRKKTKHRSKTKKRQLLS
jgi:hypothetical protein